MEFIAAQDLVLFQGDSITDAGRDYSDYHSLGCGYVHLIASWFSALYPEKGVRFLNRGVSGNRVPDLEARWEQDCLQLQPDVLSIMIGINDCWRRFSQNDPTSAQDYEGGYRRLLTRVREKTNAKIILLEPFLVPVSPELGAWREDLDPKIHAVRQLARDFAALYVPLDGLFAQACTKQKPNFWAGDGVHPTGEGHALIAQAWLRTVGVEV